MIPEYKYQVKDFSFITPYYRTYVAAPMLRFLPMGLPANIITIISNIFMFTALGLAFWKGSDFKPNFIIIPILVFMYLLFDHFDGMQAKRTKTSSALGEFFDHFLDVFNNGTLFSIIFLMYGVKSPWLIAGLLSVSYLAHAAVFFEQFKTKWLIFEKMGSFEAVLMVSFLIVISIFSPVYTFLITPAFYGFTWIEWVLIFASISEFITMVQTLLRAKTININFISFFLSQITVALVTAYYFADTLWIMFFIVSMYSANYIGRLQRAHLAGTKEPYADVGFIIILLSPLLLNNFMATNAHKFGIVLFLGGTIVIISAHTIYLLRKFWVWKNPKINS